MDMSEIKINPRVGWRTIEKEAILFNCDTQEICILNETGSNLWETIADGADFSRLVNSLKKKYSLSDEVAKKDTISFLEQLNSGGYIRFINGEKWPDHRVSSEAENILIELEMQAIRNFIPFSVTFETTYSCNEGCIHCFMDKNLPSLDPSDIKRILKEIADAGCLFITLTGGEFFTRADFAEILESVSGLHFAIDILSNGSLITQDIAESLANCPVRRVQLTLCGATPEVHDYVTRLEGSFDKTMNAIHFLRNSGIKIEIAFPLMGLNFHQRYLAKQIVESLDCLFFPSHIITARNNGLKDTFGLRIDDAQLKTFLADKKLFKLYGGRKPFQDHQFYLNIPDIQDAAPCYSGFNTCAITPNGKVLPCNQLLYEVGDLAKESFAEIWKHSSGLKYLRNLKIRDLPECLKCKHLPFCSRCPGLALLEGGDLLGISPENCRITKNSCELLKEEDIP